MCTPKRKAPRDSDLNPWLSARDYTRVIQPSLHYSNGWCTLVISKHGNYISRTMNMYRVVFRCNAPCGAIPKDGAAVADQAQILVGTSTRMDHHPTSEGLFASLKSTIVLVVAFEISLNVLEGTGIGSLHFCWKSHPCLQLHMFEKCLKTNKTQQLAVDHGFEVRIIVSSPLLCRFI